MKYTSLFIAIIVGFLIHTTTFAQDSVTLIPFTLKDQFNTELVRQHIIVARGGSRWACIPNAIAGHEGRRYKFRFQLLNL